MAETFRTAKLERFIQKQVDHMNSQERILEKLRKREGNKDVAEVIESITMSKFSAFTYTLELCKEFDIKMPEVLGGMEVEIVEEES